MPSPSPAAIAAAWQAYEKETWEPHRDKDDAKVKVMQAAIEAAAKADGVEWERRS